MDINLTIATTAVLGTVIALFGAISAVLYSGRQSEHAKAALCVEIIRDLEKQFSSETMVKTRLVLARFLINRKPNDKPVSACEDILDFFDTLGTYHLKGALDLEMSWSMFYFWFGHYWQLLKDDADYFEHLQDGVAYYRDIRRLYKKLTQYGQKSRNLPKKEAAYFSPNGLKRFLEHEITDCISLLQEYEKTGLSAEQKSLLKGKTVNELKIRMGQKLLLISIEKL